MNKKYSLAIIGATGLVGQTIIQVLAEKNLNIDKYYFLASKKSDGKNMTFKDKEYNIAELTPNFFNTNKIDFAIFASESAISKKYAPIATRTGTIVIDNSSVFRMDNLVPLVVPEVNKDDIFNHKGIIANPNCSTIQAVVPLKPIYDKFKIKRIIYSTYQAVSGAGREGIEDFYNGINNIPPTKFQYPIFNNCIPQIDLFLDNGYTKEEEKMINETKKIFHDSNLKVTATCVRVPVINSHSESINIETKEYFTLTQIQELLKFAPGVQLKDNILENIYPLPQDANDQDKVLVGRVRRDYSTENALNLWVVADNLRKGAATNAIQILEILLKHSI